VAYTLINAWVEDEPEKILPPAGEQLRGVVTCTCPQDMGKDRLDASAEESLRLAQKIRRRGQVRPCDAWSGARPCCAPRRCAAW